MAQSMPDQCGTWSKYCDYVRKFLCDIFSCPSTITLDYKSVGIRTIFSGAPLLLSKCVPKNLKTAKTIEMELLPKLDNYKKFQLDLFLKNVITLFVAYKVIKL